ncbi:hypothetical protein H5085_00855 [Pseudoalteromonas sp. SR43-6]|uniref:hypothetical protein n=1 Tax=unclassified Pseudoalteromonas TaxID=194690 RepID=UPI0015FD783A|nr:MULTISPECIES: hypothetical protein [unclassified Pseudoalteromonas]MBB1287971.1 hypothetical protein [Pseudoalteromonas sp. SR41-5]MBB1372899.1 hypothetical protein [Pseudoalteromonas sp. SR43-6]MBB1412612.1 hypothetical protein [Pseudoalteromonas sp. SG43-8]
MPLMRLLGISLLSFLLTACGGGGSLEKDGSISDDDSTTEAATYSVSLKGYSQTDATESNSVTPTSSLDLRAILTQDGEIVAGKRITFTLEDDIGELSPSSALTQNDGIATVELTAGAQAGAGEVTATYTVDGESYTSTFAFQSSGGQGDDTGVSGSTTLTVNIVDENGAKYSDTNPVTTDNLGTVTAILKNDGVALSEQLVTFTTNFTGKITPDLGTAITNSAGEAKVTLSSGSFKGAGQVVATYNPTNSTEVSNTAVFYSSGDSAPVDLAQFSISVKLLTGCNAGWDDNRSSVKLDPTQASSGCTVANTISSSELGELFVEVIDEQSGEGSKNSLVNISTNLGSVLPSSGTALTDNFGIALLKLQPGNTGGAGTVTVTSVGETNSTNFAVGIADLTLEVDNGLNKDTSGNVIPLKAGGSTVIEVTLLDEDGNLYLTPTDVEFSSTCVISGDSVIDASVKSSSGIATSTYRATGCSIDDDINITVETGGKNFTATSIIPVETSAVQSIQFVDVSETFIALPPGEGGAPTQSIVRFKLIDADGLASTQQRIDFKLTDSVGAAKLSLRTSDTNNEGFVQTTVESGIVPGPLVVKACFISKEDVNNLPEGDDLTCWVDDVELCASEPNNEICPDGTLTLVPLSEQISSVSAQLTLASGVTDQNSFDASPNTFNTNSLNYNGVLNDITVYFGDQFNNYNGDGVEATILAEAGVIGSSSNEVTCKTDDATCVVTWRSQGDRPFYDYKWGNRIGDIDGDVTTTEGINPKTGIINCDPYFGIAAPCINGITRAKNSADGVVMGGRVSILAVTKGQENFVDEQTTDDVKRTNGLFDIGEYYTSYDLPEAFIDHNENAAFDKANCSDADASNYDPSTDECSELISRGGHNETWRDLDNDGIYDFADGKYNGLLCSEAAENAGECSRELIEVRKQIELVMSGDNPYVRFSVLKTTDILDAPYPVYVPADCSVSVVAVLEPSDVSERCDISAVDLSNVLADNPAYDETDPDETDPEQLEVGLAGITIRIHYTDEFGNPLPAGTTVSISSTNGDLSIIENNAIIPSTNTDKPMYSDVRISREADGNDKFDGVLSITFEFTTQAGGTKTVSKGIEIYDSK